MSNFTKSLTLYYDGLCPLCSREIEMYRKKDLGDVLSFIDITRNGFSAEKEGLDPLRVKQVFHVRKPDGTLLTGVDAFAEIWRVLPGFKALHWLSQQSISRPLMNLGYQIFAQLRPFLPRKKECETGACNL